MSSESKPELNEVKEDEEDNEPELTDEQLKQKKQRIFMQNIDKPFIARPYVSKTVDETHQEIKNQLVMKSRPLIKQKFSKKRKYFNGNYKFNDSDASDRQNDIKATNDLLFHTKKTIIEIGLQGKNEIKTIGTQTNWNKKINRVLEPIRPIQEIDLGEEEEKNLKVFIQTVYPIMENALQSTETIDIFQDDFDVLPQEEFNKNDTEVSNTIKEVKSFQSLKSKGKRVNCIQFQPGQTQQKSKYIVAQSFTENLSFDERAQLSTKSYNSRILFWDFQFIHSIDPVLELESQLEITCFEFNPKDGNVLVGGSLNGQILLWDLKSFNQKMNNKKNQKSKTEKCDQCMKINPLTMSTLQDPSGQSGTGAEVVRKQVNSHKNPVLCIRWLPTGIEFDRKQYYNLLTTNGEIHNQFISISEDGQILFWDTRIGDKPDQRGSQIQKPQVVDITTIPWKAHYGVQIFRPDGGGHMGGSHLQFNRNQKGSTLVGTTDEGELFYMDWLQRQTDDNTKADMVNKLWSQERNLRPVIGLDRSQFYDDIALTIHDYHFVIWKLDTNEPIFQSMLLKNCQMTCGCFSPSRPGLVFIGRTDGRLDIWDFTDQSHQETMFHQVSSTGISSIKFHDHPQMTNHIAVGDFDGTLHILELPQMLHKKQANEENLIHDFWAREVKRVLYFQNRFQIRDEIYKEFKQQQNMVEEEVKDKDKDQQDELEIENSYQAFLLAYQEVLNPPLEKKK